MALSTQAASGPVKNAGGSAWQASDDAVPVLQTLAYLKVHHTVEGREGWALCPLHEEDTPSCHVDLATGRWYCHGCQRGGSLEDLVTGIVGDPIAALGVIRRARRLTGLTTPGYWPGEAQQQLTPVDPLVRWRRFRQVDWLTVEFDHPVWSYLRGRGFTRETLQGFDVRLTDWEEYPVVFPILERDKIAGYVRRRVDNPTDKRKKKYLYNSDLHAKDHVAYFAMDDRGPCVLVEGVLDMMKCFQNGARHVAALLGWRMNQAKYRSLRDFGVTSVVCVTDNTPTGEQGWEQVREYFNDAVRFRYPGDWVKDAGELSSHEFLGGMP